MSDFTYQIGSFKAFPPIVNPSRTVFKGIINESILKRFHIFYQKNNGLLCTVLFDNKFDAFYTTLLHNYNSSFQMRKINNKTKKKNLFSLDLNIYIYQVCEMNKKQINNKVYTSTHKQFKKYIKQF